MVEAILTTLGVYIPLIGTMFSSVFESVASVFYTPGLLEAPGEMTVIGGLALVAVAIGLFMFGFRFVLKLLRIKA
jgi:hypothetical protein